LTRPRPTDSLRALQRTPALAALVLGLTGLLPRLAIAQGAPIVGTAEVTLSPNPVTATSGTSVVVNLEVDLAGVTGKSSSGTNTAAVLGGYQTILLFDKTRLRLDSVAGGTSAGYTSAPTFTNVAAANASGSVTLVSSQTSPVAPTGKVAVALLSFTALATGTSMLAPMPVSLVSTLQPGPPAVGPATIGGIGVFPQNFFTLTPCRAIDTRSANAPALVAGAKRTFIMTGPAVGQCSIPASARALSINVTVAGATAAGNLSLFPGGTSSPGTSAINYRLGQTRANQAVVTLGTAGDLSFACQQASGTVHLIVDANGYFQ
jgi:hypothetical protein